MMTLLSLGQNRRVSDRTDKARAIERRGSTQVSNRSGARPGL